MKKFLIVFSIIATVLTGCKLDNSVLPDDSGTPTNPPPTTSASIVGVWKMQSAHTKGKLLGIDVDATSAGTAEDYYNFKADGTVDVSSADDGLEKGTYTYNATTKKLTLIKGTETSSITITSLTATTMSYELTILVPAIGTDAKITATFKRS